MKPDHNRASIDFKSIKEVEANAKTRMEKALSDLQHEMAAIRTGRASVSHARQHPRGLLRHAHAPEPGRHPACARARDDHGPAWDVSQIGPIEKAIRASDLGLNPRNDGKLIRVPIPPLTEERRKELVKQLHHVAEDHRVAVRNIRRDANEAVKKLLKDKTISEDEDQRAHDEIQKMTDAMIQKLDQASKTKEKEILELK